MIARHIPRIDIHNQMELKNALPLRTPYVIHIDPSDTCNFRCKFCPSGNPELMKKNKGRGHGPMDYVLYRQIIDSLAEFDDPVRVVRLYKEGEPLVNPHFADMVRYAKHVYYNRKRDWNKIVDRAMAKDFSWVSSARKYEEL